MKNSQKPKIRISVVTRRDTTSWQVGEEFLKILEKTNPQLMPERIGNSEPIRTPFESIDSCRNHWAPEGVIDAGPYGKSYIKWNFLWKRTKTVKSYGHFLHTSFDKFNELNPGWFVFSSEAGKKTNWRAFFKELCVLLPPKFATLHLVSEVEDRDGAFSEESLENFGVNDFLEGTPGVALRERGLANLAWASFFGEEYASEIDAPKLKADGFDIEEVGEGFLVTLTPSIFDVVDRFELFSARRVELKGQLRPGLFRIKEEPKFLM